MDGKYLPRLPLANLFIVIAVQIGGFALLWSKDTPPPEYVYLPATADRTAADPAVNTPVVVVSPPDEKALREIIQAILKQELTPYNRSTVAMPPASPTTKEKSPENIQAYNKASNIIDSALAQGVWASEFNMELQALSNQLTPDQHEKLLDKVGRAINRNELKINAENAPVF